MPLNDTPRQTTEHPPGLDSLLERASVLTPGPLPGWQGKGQTDVLRLDALHPQWSGNKAFKLAGHLKGFREQASLIRILSFGGPWSNHLHALAAVAHDCGLPSVGVVRGYAHLPLTDTLKDCQQQGMELVFVDKKTYARRNDPAWQQVLSQQWQAMVIPEGGSGPAGEAGFALLKPLLQDYDEVWIAAGTGTSARGLAACLRPDQTLMAVNAVADQGALQRHWQTLDWSCHWQILRDPRCGRFGQCPPVLQALIARYDLLGLPLEPVYTARLLLTLEAQQEAGLLGDKTRLLIHTGGLQGRRGYPELTPR